MDDNVGESNLYAKAAIFLDPIVPTAFVEAVISVKRSKPECGQRKIRDNA
jgi:hypothetical protein